MRLHLMPYRFLVFFISAFILFCLISCDEANSQTQMIVKAKVAQISDIALESDEDYQEYLSFFEEVYQIMESNYYHPIPREAYERFIEKFDTKIYSQLKGENKSNDYIRWRSAAFMIDFFKPEEDIFSAFYPPKPAKEYEETVLGKRIDLGIEGGLIDQGFQTIYVEPRSDAYKNGLRKDDIILKIDERDVVDLKAEEITKLLTPLENTTVTITYLDFKNKIKREINVISQEYFKQTVFMARVEVPHIYCLEIRRFNRKTAEDVFRFLKFMREQGPIKGLILDFRGNPGGPPLAAREISSFFLTPGEDFAYFQKRGQPKASLDVPKIPQSYHYDGPMVILVNEKSGSSSELFSGILQRRGRAILMGQNSAGQVFLKSMFHFDDESMLLLVTARGHHPDGKPFSFQGLIPDRYIREEEDIDIIKYAATYLYYMNNREKFL